MDKEKAYKYYTRQKSLPALKKLPEIEEHFFADNHFIPGFKLSLLDEGRSFYVSKDNRFYFSPDWFSKNVFKIYDCSLIKDVCLTETNSSSLALDGALLFGAAGAVAGSDSKSSNYCIKVTLDDPQNPLMFALLSIGFVGKGTQEYRQMLIQSEKIINKLKSYIRSEEPAPAVSASSDDFMNKLRELMEMKKEGLLTDEEFAAAKTKLLS